MSVRALPRLLLALLLAPAAALALPLKVHVAIVTRGHYRPEVTALAQVHAAERVEMRAPYTAVMGRWLVPAGATVPAHRELVRLWPVDEAHRVAALHARVAAASAAEHQGRILAAQGLISASRLRTRQAALAQAQAQLASAQARLSYGALRAPFSGTVRFIVSSGAWVRRGVVVAAVDGRGGRYYTAALTGRAAHLLGVGATARLRGQLHPAGRLYAFGARLDRVGLVTAYIRDVHSHARPGAIIRLQLLGAARPGLRVPKSALILHNGRVRIFRVVDGRVEAVTVAILSLGKTNAYIEGPITPGARVVADHVDHLVPGLAVRIAP